MGSMLVAVIPSKSTKNMRRIPNPFSQPRLAISNPESRLFTPIKATWDILPEVWRLWALNKACDGFTHWGWSTVLAGTTCFGSLLEYLREPARTRTDKRRRRLCGFKQNTHLGKSSSYCCEHRSAAISIPRGVCCCFPARVYFPEMISYGFFREFPLLFSLPMFLSNWQIRKGMW